MRDFKNEVYDALIAACPRVYFYYPNNFIKTPVISYYDNGNSSDDGRDLLTKVSYQVDVWSKTVAECKATAAAADMAMRKLGFRRSFSQMVPDSSGYRHQSMRYEGTYNALDKKLYSQ